MFNEYQIGMPGKSSFGFRYKGGGGGGPKSYEVIEPRQFKLPEYNDFIHQQTTEMDQVNMFHLQRQMDTGEISRGGSAPNFANPALMKSRLNSQTNRTVRGNDSTAREGVAAQFTNQQNLIRESALEQNTMDRRDISDQARRSAASLGMQDFSNNAQANQLVQGGINSQNQLSMQANQQAYSAQIQGMSGIYNSQRALSNGPTAMGAAIAGGIGGLTGSIYNNARQYYSDQGYDVGSQYYVNQFNNGG